MKWSKANHIRRINPKKMNRNNLIMLLLLAVTVSCSGNRTVRNPQSIYGNSMVLPEAGSWVIQGRGKITPERFAEIIAARASFL